jgi:hypothetical protein
MKSHNSRSGPFPLAAQLLAGRTHARTREISFSYFRLTGEVVITKDKHQIVDRGHPFRQRGKLFSLVKAQVQVVVDVGCREETDADVCAANVRVVQLLQCVCSAKMHNCRTDMPGVPHVAVGVPHIHESSRRIVGTVDVGFDAHPCTPGSINST